MEANAYLSSWLARARAMDNHNHLTLYLATHVAASALRNAGYDAERLERCGNHQEAFTELVELRRTVTGHLGLALQSLAETMKRGATTAAEFEYSPGAALCMAVGRFLAVGVSQETMDQALA